MLAGRPPGATILLSHSPWESRAAAAAGAGLLLAGHTHEGQIWPFNYMVRLRYPLLGGRYDIDGMSAIVCRGTGTCIGLGSESETVWACRAEDIG